MLVRRKQSMRPLAFLVLMVIVGLPASAAKRISVQELDQRLAALRGKPDAETARHFADVELSERPTETTLMRWRTDFPGPLTGQALSLVVDAAAFLDLPSTEIPSMAAPDHETQRHIMALTVDYVSKTIHQLPNLFATRRTSHFEDTPQGYSKGGIVFVPAQPIHFTGTTTNTIAYRDGGEVLDSKPTQPIKSEAVSYGLSTSGEFGPILVTILIDAAHSSLSWSHWENRAPGSLAVFRYSVPAEKSHYEVGYCCISSPGAPAAALQPFHRISGYHGEIAVHPATGSILRVTVQADLNKADPIVRADIMVEYGPVQLGSKIYICPQRSVAISMGQALQTSQLQRTNIVNATREVQYEPGHMQTMLNEVWFEQYHLFGAETRLMLADSGRSTKDIGSVNAPPPEPTASVPPNPPAAVTSDATSPAVEASGTARVAPASPPELQPVPTKSEGSTEGPPAERSAAASFDLPAISGASQERSPIFQASSRAVVVDVVVTKRGDEPVTGLQKEDFQVSEDGKSQSVDFFEEHAKGNQQATSLPPMPPNVFTNRPATPPGDSVNVLLLDSLNTPRSDQVYVHAEVMKFFKSISPGTRMAIFALGSSLRYVQGFTDDPSLLRAALTDSENRVKVDSTPASRTREDDAADADNIKMLETMAGGNRTAGVDAAEKAFSDRAEYQANERVTITLEAFQHLARYLAGIPGRKNLIWFSSTFPVTIFPSGREATVAGGQRAYNQAIRSTADLLTTSQIAVYPVGAEGMIVNRTVDAQADLSEPTNSMAPMADSADVNRARAATITAMEQLASITGGEAIFNTNDLGKAVARAVQNGSNYYTLVYTPTNKNNDGQYRRIDIRLNKANYKVAYRRGYYADNRGQEGSDLAVSDANPLRPLLARGLPSATQVLYGVRVLPSATQPARDAPRAGGNQRLSGSLTRYDVDFMIRWTDVDLQTTPEGTHSGQIQIGLVAYGPNGVPVNWTGAIQKMNLNTATFAAIQRSGIPAHLEIDLPEQELYLTTGVYDWPSRRAGTLEIPLNSSHAQTASGPAKPD